MSLRYSGESASSAAKRKRVTVSSLEAMSMADSSAPVISVTGTDPNARAMMTTSVVFAVSNSAFPVPSTGRSSAVV